jgi:hypothetical protein
VFSFQSIAGKLKSPIRCIFGDFISETQFEDRKILTSELFPDNFNYDVYRNDRTLNGGGVILLVNKTYNSMPLYNLENGSESVWAKIMFDGSPHFFGCWYKDPESPSDYIQLLDDRLIKIGGQNNIKKITKYTSYGRL